MSVSKNTAYNLVGSIAPMFVSIVSVPIYLRLIGDERYGILAIAWAFLGYFGLFDLGLGRATAQRIAATSSEDPRARNDIFWTALLLNTALGLFASLILWPAGYFFFSEYFRVSEQLRQEILSAVPWLAATLPLTMISGVLSGALQGCERFKEVNATSILGTMLSQLIPLFVAWFFGPNIVWIICSALLSRVIILVVLFIQCHQYVPLSRPIAPERALVISLFRFGGSVAVTGIIGPLLTTLDRFIIGWVSGAKAVTYYTVPFNLASRISVLPGSLASALFPRFASASPSERRVLLEKSVIVLNAMQTPIIVMGLLIMEPFLRLWIDPAFAARASLVGQIIVVGLWFNGLAVLPYTQLQGQGRPGFVAICHLAELPPYLLALYYGLHFWGVAGAALAWSLRMAVDLVLLFWGSDFPMRRVTLLFMPIALIVASTILVLSISSASVLYWVLACSLVVISFYWAWSASPDALTNLINKSFRRKTPAAVGL